jgi:hypothetical protein
MEEEKIYDEFLKYFPKGSLRAFRSFFGVNPNTLDYIFEN